jgi:hypothetical protein
MEKNKKISFYEETMKLSHFDNEMDEKNIMIKDLKDENRELKFKLDNI